MEDNNEQINEDSSNQSSNGSVEKMTKKVTKKAAKGASKAAAKQSLISALGPILVWVIIIIVAIIIIIGIIMFLLTMPGMVMQNLKELGKSVADMLLNFFGVDQTKEVSDEEIYNSLNYIEQMGYDLKGFGFLTNYITSKDEVDKNVDRSNGVVLDAKQGVIRDNDGKIITADSDFLYNYMVSDNYVYTLSKDNSASGFTGVLGGIVGLGQRFIDLLTAGQTQQYWSRGFIKIHKDNGILGTVGEYYIDSPLEQIKIDPQGETLEITKGLFSGNSMKYSLDGWTGRYGMPLEFLLSIHLATYMPDLAYDMATSFKTQLYLLLHNIGSGNADAVGYYKASDGQYISYDDFKNIAETTFFDGWRISNEEGMKMFKEHPGLKSPSDCLGPTGESDQTVKDVAEQSSSNISTLNNDTYKNETIITYNNILKNLSNYGFSGQDDLPVSISTFEEFENLLKEEQTTKDTWEVIAREKNHKANEPLADGEVIKSSTIEVMWNGKYDNEDCKYMTKVNLEYKNYDSFDENNSANGEHYVKISYTAIKRTWTKSEYDKALSEKKAGMTEEELAGKTDDEILELIKCSEAGDELNFDKCCNVCRAYLQKIFDYVKKVDCSNLKVDQPYIAYVKNHWYRDVYFVSQPDVEFVNYDTEYEAVMKERWTLYETYTDSADGLSGDQKYRVSPLRAGDYILYALDANGKYAKNKSQIANYDKNKDKLKEANGYYIYDGTLEEANADNIKVAKRAITSKMSEIYKDLSWNEVQTNTYSAYSLGSGSITTRQAAYSDVEEGDADKEIKQNVYVDITLGNQIEQTGDGQRAETNSEIKKMFLENTYFRYDGNPETAEAITKLRQKYDLNYGALNKRSNQNNRDLERILELSVKIGEGKDKKEYAVKDVSGQVSLNQDSLNAFSILENEHTLDADYIYRDFKELVVELGYFTKEELKEETPKLLEFPIPDIGSYGYPKRVIDKRENEFGTMIHSKYDIDANEKYTIRERLLKALDEVGDFENTLQSNAISDLNLDISSINSLKAAVGAINGGGLGGTKDPAEVSVQEFLEKAAEVHSRMEGGDWEYCAAGRHSGETGKHIARGACPSVYDTYEASASGGRTADCSSYVSWVLQEVGVLPVGTRWYTGAMITGFAEYLLTRSEAGELQAGDIVISPDHVQINGENNMQYNAGSTGAITSPPSEYFPDFYTYVIRLPFNNNNKSTEEEVYEGYEGNEAVVSPVTGILLEYGTYDKNDKNSVTGEEYRVNVDLKYGPSIDLETNSDKGDTKSTSKNKESTAEKGKIVTDKVGYAKILVLNDEAYQILESNTQNQWKKNSLLKDTGGYYEKLEKTEDGLKDQLDKMSQLDKTVYGYKEFVELYDKFGIAGNIIYIDGFKPELPDESLVSDSSDDTSNSSDSGLDAIPKGEELKKSSFKIDSTELDNENELIQSLYERDEEYSTASEETNVKLNGETELKDQASPALFIDKKIKVGNKDYKALFIKEGTVLGRTYTDKELVEELRKEKFDDYKNAVKVKKDSESDSEDKNTDKVIGNYLRVIMRDKDDTVIEDIENYMKLDDGEEKKKDVDIDWEFWYFSPFEGTGWDPGYGWGGDESGPEAVKNNFAHRSTYSRGGYNYDVGIIQWTTNVSINIISKFCKAAAEYDTNLCSSLARYADKDYAWYDNQANMDQLQATFTEICNKDRDGFTQVQINLAKWGASGEQDGERGDLSAYWGMALDKYPWLEERRGVVQGSVMSACVARGQVPGLSESMTDEEIINTAIGTLANSLADRKQKQTKAALDILHNNYSAEELENWVRTMTPPNGASW